MISVCFFIDCICRRKKDADLFIIRDGYTATSVGRGWAEAVFEVKKNHLGRSSEVKEKKYIKELKEIDR